MAGLIGSLHSAGTGMSVSQASIQTTSHNINNMNTPGYSRQKVEQSAKSAYSNPGYNSSLGPGQLGTGVQATDIVRIRNTFYDFQYRNETHNYGQTSIKYQHYTNMEKIFNEPSDSAISSSMSEFFSSWQELSKSPNDEGAKDIVIQNAKYLANNISTVKSKLDQLSSQAEKKLNDDVSEINDMLNQIRDLNKDIKLIQGSGKTPNDLMDKRDAVIDDLSYKLNLENSDVQKLINKKLEDGTPVTLDELKNIKGVSGEIQGSLDMIDKISEYTDYLTNLAKGLSQAVNNILNGKDANNTDAIPSTNQVIFEFNADEDPIIKANDKLLDSPKDLFITADVAQKMYNLKDEKITIDGEDITIGNYYNNIIQKLGNESKEVIRAEKNQSKLIEEIDNLRLNVSGVSLDEEMVNLIQFQHSYNASAKVISTIDSLLDVVVNSLVR
nr:flagellar hook-associated protein FlgK [uncultured Romboutsia sp.]